MKMKHYLSDPVLLRSDFCCVYCGCDLLADLDSFLSLVRDHFRPRSAGGCDGNDNRVCSCATCDRIKAGREFATLDEARVFIQQYRASVGEWFVFVRAAVR